MSWNVKRSGWPRPRTGAYYDAENARYFSFMDANGRSGLSELTQALCVVSGICPDGEAARVCESLTSGDLVPATLAYTAFKYDALLSRAEGYGDWVRRDVETQWGKMLFAGATSFWETIDGADAFDNAGSLCHGCRRCPRICISPTALASRRKSRLGWNRSPSGGWYAAREKRRDSAV